MDLSFSEGSHSCPLRDLLGELLSPDQSLRIFHDRDLLSDHRFSLHDRNLEIPVVQVFGSLLPVIDDVLPLLSWRSSSPVDGRDRKGETVHVDYRSGHKASMASSCMGLELCPIDLVAREHWIISDLALPRSGDMDITSGLLLDQEQTMKLEKEEKFPRKEDRGGDPVRDLLTEYWKEIEKKSA